MARTAIPVMELGFDEIDTQSTSITMPTTGVGMYIPETYLDDGHRLFLRCSISSVSTSDTIVVKAGDGMRSGMGDLTYLNTDGTAVVKIIGPLDTSRFKVQNSATEKGNILIDTTSYHLVGSIMGFRVPR